MYIQVTKEQALALLEKRTAPEQRTKKLTDTFVALMAEINQGREADEAYLEELRAAHADDGDYEEDDDIDLYDNDLGEDRYSADDQQDVEDLADRFVRELLSV